MNKLMNRKRYIFIFVMPAFLLFVVFMAVPLIMTGIYGLFDYDGIGKMSFAGIQNYINLFAKDRHFPHAMVNSLILAAASIVIQLTLAFLLAIALNKGIKGEKFFRTVYFIPVVITTTVISQLWMKIFNSDYGLLNVFLSLFKFADYNFSWLTTPSTAFMTTVVAGVWQYIGYYMLIMYAGMKSISPEYYEDAKLDGANGFQTITKITLPLLAPVIETCVLFALTGSLRSFDFVYIMTNGGPNHASDLPATLMYNNLFRRGLYGYGSAQAFFIVFECLIFTFIIKKPFKKADDNASGI